MTGYIQHPETTQRRYAHVKSLLGETIGGLLIEPDVTDIILNPPLGGQEEGIVWVSRQGRPTESVTTMSMGQAERLISAVASTLFTVVTREQPYIEGELLIDGSRFSGGIAPIASGPFFAIRKLAPQVYDLQSYIDNGYLLRWQQDLIVRTLLDKRNVLIVGTTGAGKTTFLNALIDAVSKNMPEAHRIIILEEVKEIQVTAKNVLSMRATKNFSLRDALRAGLRQAGDCIIVGEVRGPEGLEMLKAWNTGHSGGACTLHCETSRPDAALSRLELCILEATSSPMRALIANAVSLIVCIEKDRHISQIVSIQGFDGNNYILRQEQK